jgi:hypothetical protein
MGKILNVTPNDDYTLLVEFEHGNKILFNMKPMLKSLPYQSLNDLTRFKNITLEKKAICWPNPVDTDEGIVPLRLTLDRSDSTKAGTLLSPSFFFRMPRDLLE